jgi:transposase InsO family protein
MCETCPCDSTPGYLIFDRGSCCNMEMIDAIRSFGIEPKWTNFPSPRQNGGAEHWVGSSRRDMLDHVIVLSARHLNASMSAATTKAGRILRWRGERLPVVNRRTIPKQVAAFYRCQGTAVCRTAVSWLLEFL